MKQICRACAALLSALILSLTALAGDLDFPKQSPPPPPQIIITTTSNYSILDAAAGVIVNIAAVLPRF
ncbi:MAG: hypothetical protein WCD76_12025 [Pyrinomonadaceae bacterium]